MTFLVMGLSTCPVFQLLRLFLRIGPSMLPCYPGPMGAEITMLIITREKYKYFFSTFCVLDSETEDGESVSSDGSLQTGK